MKNIIAVMFMVLVVVMATFTVSAQTNPTVGGAKMLNNKNIIDNLTLSKDHKKLISILKVAGLTETLNKSDSFTIFAPTDAAFNELSSDDVKGMLDPKNKAIMNKFMSFHIIAGNLDSETIIAAIKKNYESNGKNRADYKTLSGVTLTFALDGKQLVAVDNEGGIAKIVIADVKTSNGIIHVINAVLFDK
jgi:uncharacterized surface protein with fasciclin (FAS1) repeats